jgi:5-methylcytosine-specific restriction endonuclease McrA
MESTVMPDTAGSIRSVQCRAQLKALRDEYGYGIFDACIRELNRGRLQTDTRQRRERFKPRIYKLLYHRQGGICLLCGLGMIMPKSFPGGLEIDHIDPNRQDFNDPRNLQLAHESCNRKKGAKSVQEQSKCSGRTFEQIVRVPIDEDGEHIEHEEPEKPKFLRMVMD